MRRALLAALPVVLIALQSPVAPPADLVRLEKMTELTSEPGGARLGVLMEGLALSVVETRGEWARVRIEGWVPAEDVIAPGSPPPFDPGPAPAPPVVAPPTAAGGVSGAILLVREGATLVGTATAVRLIAGAGDVRTRIEAVRAECDARHVDLEAEAARLKSAMNAAMRLEDTSAAFERYDQAKWARDRILADLARADLECLEQVDAAVQPLEAARALTDEAGRFAFDGIAPGDYLILAWFEGTKERFVWETPVRVEAGRRAAIDLTEANLTRSDPLSRR